MMPSTARRRAQVAVVGLAVLATISASACRADNETTSSAIGPQTAPTTNALGGKISGPADLTTVTDGGKLVFGLEAEPEGLDPSRYAFAGSGHMVASAVMDTLMKLDDSGNPVPNLATAMEPSADFKTWTIAVPTGVKFSDGTDLTAQVVKYDLTKSRDSYITGSDWKGVDSIEAPDDTHVVVKWSFPYASFPAQLTTQAGYVFAPKTNENDADKPIGTGPFVLESHVLNKSWTFKKNTNYWRKGLPHLDTIEFQPIPDDSQRIAALQGGDIDMMVTLRPAQIEQLRVDPKLKLVENGGGEEEHLPLNTTKAPFDKLIARQAVAYATDAITWRKKIMDDIVAPANGPLAPGQIGYLEDNGFPKYDLDKAKALVKQYEAETGLPFEFVFIAQAEVSNTGDAQLLADMFTAAGMKVTIKPLAQINIIAAAAAGAYQMIRFRLYSSANPDSDAVAFWRSAAIDTISLNFTRFADPKMDDAIYTAIGTTDPAKRQAAYEIVNREFGSQIPDVWLGRTVWVMAAQPKVNGIYAAANGTVQTIGSKTWLADLWIAK